MGNDSRAGWGLPSRSRPAGQLPACSRFVTPMARAESLRRAPWKQSTSGARLGRLPDIEAAAAFALAASGVALYALRRGSYDLVLRQEFGFAVWWILALGLVTGVLPRARPHR